MKKDLLMNRVRRMAKRMTNRWGAVLVLGILVLVGYGASGWCAQTGTVKWKFRTADSEADFAPAMDGSGNLYVAESRKGLLIALRSDGSEKWRIEGSGISKPAFASDGTLYVTTGYETIEAWTTSGEAKWSFDILEHGADADSWYWGTIPVTGTDDTVYAGFSANGGSLLYAVDSLGQEKWRVSLEGTIKGLATASDGTLYVATNVTVAQSYGLGILWPEHGELHALKPDGSSKWTFHMDSVCRTRPVVAPDETIYLGGEDGLHVIRADDGTQKEVVFEGDDIDLPAAVDSDGTVYVVIDARLWTYDPVNGQEEKLFDAYVCSPYSAPAVGADGNVFFVVCERLYCISKDGDEVWHRSMDSSFTWSENDLVVGPDGTVYAPFYGTLAAVDHGTGEVIWNFDIEAGILTSPAIGTDGTVYFVDWNGTLYALNADGTVKWTRSGSDLEFWAISSVSIAEDGTLYITGSGLLALNPDGDVKWRSPGGWCYGEPTIGPDGTVYYGDSDGVLRAVAPDGSVKWEYDINAAQPPATSSAKGGVSVGVQNTYGIYAAPVIGTDGTLYFGTEDGNIYALSPEGTLKWTYPTGDLVWGSAAIGADGTIYVGSPDRKVYALSPEGDLKWTYPTGDLVWGSAAIGADGTIYIGSDDGNVYALTSEGDLKWTYQTGDWVESSAAIGADGTIYIGSDDGNVYALTSEGDLKWTYQTGDWVESSAAIGADGTIYIGSYDGYLYALNSECGGPADTAWPMYLHDPQHTGRARNANPGDMNGDGAVTATDALCVLQKIVVICPTSCGACDEMDGDVNGDGQESASDALCILQYFVHLPSCLD